MLILDRLLLWATLHSRILSAIVLTLPALTSLALTLGLSLVLPILMVGFGLGNAPSGRFISLRRCTSYLADLLMDEAVVD